MSGYHKIHTYRTTTQEELQQVFGLIWEIEAHDDHAYPHEPVPSYGMVYTIGFPPDQPQSRSFIDPTSPSDERIIAQGYIWDDEPNGFGTILWGTNSHNEVVTEEA